MDAQFPDIPAGTPVDHGDLYRFGARHAIIVNQAQEAFSEWLGDWSRFQIDPETQSIALDDRVLKAQLLGSHSYESDTWLWAWGNEGYQAPETAGFAEASRWLRDASPDREHAWQLRTRLFPVNEQLAAGGGTTGWPVLYACYGWLRPKAVFQFEYGPGRAFMSIHDEQVPAFAPTPVTLPRQASDSFAASPGVPFAELLQTYAAWHRLGYQASPEGLTVSFPGGSEFTFKLDDQQRPASVTGTMQAADLPPGQPSQ